MANRASVKVKKTLVGTEFNTDLFTQAVTPEVTVPADLQAESLTVSGNVVVNGTLTGPDVRRNILQLDDVDNTNVPTEGQVLSFNTQTLKFQPTTVDTTGGGSGLNPNLFDIENPQDLAIIQYDASSGKWVDRTEDEFYDATIDGGLSNSAYVEAFDIDGGFA